MFAGLCLPCRDSIDTPEGSGKQDHWVKMLKLYNNIPLEESFENVTIEDFVFAEKPRPARRSQTVETPQTVLHQMKYIPVRLRRQGIAVRGAPVSINQRSQEEGEDDHTLTVDTPEKVDWIREDGRHMDARMGEEDVADYDIPDDQVTENMRKERQTFLVDDDSDEADEMDVEAGEIDVQAFIAAGREIRLGSR
ncbi:hypothetical protein NHQ30_011300 [Ciborinia camelliae]|nr:hypothetical protein NHQ30_011300 [Ciborinia camelliae]